MNGQNGEAVGVFGAEGNRLARLAAPYFTGQGSLFRYSWLTEMCDRSKSLMPLREALMCRLALLRCVALIDVWLRVLN